MDNPYAQLIGYWLLYFIIHSLFASVWMKNLFRKFAPSVFRYFRLIYVIFSFLLLSPVLLFGILIPSEYIYEVSDFSQIAGLIIFVGGFIVFLAGLRLYDLKIFLGLDYGDNERTIPPLRTDGLLKYSRHPLYAASICMIIGYFFYSPTYGILITDVMLIFYFIIGIQFEEKKLLREHGETYKMYKRNTPMLFPGILFLIKQRKSA